MGIILHFAPAGGPSPGDFAFAAGRRLFHPAHWTLMVLLALLQPRARAENSVGYKYQDYHEADGRITVHVNSAQAEFDFGPLTQLKVLGVIDAISGATPTGQAPATPGGQVPLAHMEDERHGWNVDLSHQFGRFNLAAGYAQSRESDYHSVGWSVNSQTDFNQHNTTLLLGIAGTNDDVKVFFQQPWMDKKSTDFIVGLTQLLDPRTTVSFNLTYSHASGYLSDPYKLIQKNVEVFPGIFLQRTFAENRPDSRDRWVALAAINHAYPSLNGAIDASYRFHHDDFGITSHTLAFQWLQKLGGKVVLIPSLRFYEQSAADFYHVTLDGTNITPTASPSGKAPFYSADYRLSKLRTTSYGLKLVWNPATAWHLDVAYERYDMSGRDGITSDSAYPVADIFTIGGKFSF